MSQHSPGWRSVYVWLAVAAVCHLSWIPGTLLSRLPARTSYVSELMALDQPTSTLMRTADVVAGLAVAIAALLIHRRIRPTGRHRGPRPVLRLLIVSGLLAFGVATMVDAASPMACAPSESLHCAAAEARGHLPFHHQFHTVSSSIATLGAVVGFGSLAAALRHPGGFVVSRLPVLYVATAAAYVLSTGWVLLEIAHLGADVLGWSQRLQVTLSSACLALVPLLRVRTSGAPGEVSP